MSLKAKNTANMRRFMLTGFASAAVALALALLAAQVPILRSAGFALQDLQVAATARTLTYADVLVVDVDEPSIAGLAGQLGPWPYDRDIYALIHKYLVNSGVKVVAYDILFAESRGGDEAFAAALDAGGQSVLIASALQQGLQRGQAYRALLDKNALTGLDAVPAQRWDDVTLPVAGLINARGTRVGLNTVNLDAGGIVRRIPLIHEVHGKRHPSLHLAALMAAMPEEKLSGDAHSLSLGALRWPLAPSGEVALRFPNNGEGVPEMPFHELVAAALDRNGGQGVQAVAEMVRGKTVFIGSSSVILGDNIMTPIGQRPGLHAAALMHQMLAQGSVLAPSRPLWDAILFLLALSIPLAAFLRRADDRPYLEYLSGIVMVLVVAATSTALIAYGQQAALLFPLLAGLITYLAMLLRRMMTLSAEKRQLDVDKRAAQEAYRMKEQFMSHISHELRTPLTAIMGYNTLMADAALPAIERAKFGDVVEQNSQHLLSLINNLLDQSRMEAGQMKIVPAPTDFRRMVGDVILTLSPSAHAKNLTLDHTGADDVPAGLILDPLRVKQVLINLLGNAVKFTDTGSVKLSSHWYGGRLTFAVRDTGPGMPPEQVERIFAPFAQAHDGIAQTHGGSGLGLSISRMLCALMGGDVTVESTPGSGTVFTATILAEPCELSEVGDTTGQFTVPAKLSGCVLVADDNDLICDLVAMYLTRMGLETLTAENGRIAVDMALQKSPDLVLMDMEMPVLAGLDAVVELRKKGFTRPIVMFTAHSGDAEAALAKQAGCDAVLTKPVDRERLQLIIAKLLSRRAAKS